MLFESRCDAVFDVLPARWPPYLFALRLRLAGNGRLFDSNLLKFGWREFDSPGHAIAREFAACGPPDLFLLGLCLARSPRLFQGNFLSAGNLRSLGRGRRECGTTNNYCGHKAGTYSRGEMMHGCVPFLWHLFRLRVGELAHLEN